MKKNIKIYLILYSIFLLMAILMINSASAILDDYIYFRQNTTHNAVAYNSCGYPLLPYHKTSESGCQAYQGWTCNITMIGGTDDLSIIYSSPINYSNPIWAFKNITCVFYGVNSSGQKHIYQAWKVQSSSGQFCTIQNKWDYYIYDENFTTETLPLNVDTDYAELFEISGFCELYVPFVPAPIYSDLFNIDFTQKINLILLIIFFIVILILIFYRYLMYASILTLILGFFFLFSGVNILLSFLVIIIGAIFSGIIGGKK